MHIDLPDELPGDVAHNSEVDLVNKLADELNAEAEDVLEYQIIP